MVKIGIEWGREAEHEHEHEHESSYEYVCEDECKSEFEFERDCEHNFDQRHADFARYCEVRTTNLLSSILL